MKHTLTLLAALLLAPLATLQAADLQLGSPFSDHMVLQREKPVAVWGLAEAGESVTVAFDGQAKTATAGADGKWSLKLDALKASAESRTFTVTGKDGRKVEVKDVLVGEVWLCSGQSNMAWTFGSKQGVENNEQEIAAANYSLIRHNTYNGSSTGMPTWRVITPAAMPDISATAYFFSRRLFKELQIPIGIINRSNGGTSVEAWSSPASLSKTAWGRAVVAFAASAEMTAFKACTKDFDAEFRKFLKGNDSTMPKPKLNVPPAVMYYGLDRLYNLPSSQYERYILPTAGYGLRGVAWYQGEENAKAPLERLKAYPELLSNMVEGWRSDWGQASASGTHASGNNFPFLCVQLPNVGRLSKNGYEPSSYWAALREQFVKASVLSSRFYYAVTIDTAGELAEVHSKYKVTVGDRLALLALRETSGNTNLAAHGPEFKSMEKVGQTLVLHFDHCEGGLKMKGKRLSSFFLAGEDKTFVPAKAEIRGETVVVSADEVSAPVAVRYAWANNPPVSFYNGADLPAGPFRTDAWTIPELKDLPTP